MSLRIHSIESMGTLDGPGIRTVVFMQGCPLKCAYCHNPDTWDFNGGKEVTMDFLFNRIMRMKPYFKETGGVTFSGGEPLSQAESLIPLFQRLKSENVHIAIDTSGVLWSSAIESLLDLCDLVLLDYKHTDQEGFKSLTGGNLKQTQFFLNYLKDHQISYWIRQVVIPGITDGEAQIKRLFEATDSVYRENIQLLAFHHMGMEKWTKLGKVCPLIDTPPMSQEVIQEWMNKYNNQ